jgi:hypothetical protein
MVSNALSMKACNSSGSEGGSAAVCVAVSSEATGTSLGAGASTALASTGGGGEAGVDSSSTGEARASGTSVVLAGSFVVVVSSAIQDLSAQVEMFLSDFENYF